MVVKTLAFRWHDVTESDRLGSKTPSERRSDHHFLGITANALGPSEQHLFFLVEIVGWRFLKASMSCSCGTKVALSTVYVNREAIKEESKGWTSFLIAAFLWYSYNIPILFGAPSRHYTIDMSKWCLQTSPGMLVLKGRTLVEIVRVISEKKQTANWSK